jgi:hypothetical protein
LASVTRYRCRHMSSRTTLTQGWASKRDTPALPRLPSYNSDMRARDTTLLSAKDLANPAPKIARINAPCRPALGKDKATGAEARRVW